MLCALVLLRPLLQHLDLWHSLATLRGGFATSIYGSLCLARGRVSQLLRHHVHQLLLNYFSIVLFLNVEEFVVNV